MQKIIALDFEMYNTKYYWSICWTGMAFADARLSLTSSASIICNPGIKERFIGKTMTFPFNYKQLSGYPKFDGVAGKILPQLEGALVVGHAIENDIRMIANVCRKFGLRCPSFDFIDTNICYNALNGQSSDHSLASLAGEYGIEFSAHDPSEDARATLSVMQKLTGGDVEGFLREYKVEKGRFDHGIMRRSYSHLFGEKAIARAENYNKVFDTAERYDFGAGTRYYLSSWAAGEQDLSALAEKIVSAGDSLAIDSFCADVTITNDLTFGHEDETESLLSAVKRLGLDKSKYTYLPHKVRGKDGKGMSVTDYLNERFAPLKKSGKLSGMKFCMSRSIERDPEFYLLFETIIRCGGEVTNRIEKDVTLLVPALKDYKAGDGRVTAHKRRGGKKVMSVKQLGELAGVDFFAG